MRDRVVIVAVAGGVVTGLASTYPWELGPAVCLPAWALVGVLLGRQVGRFGGALRSGASYGVALTVSFLYSRFGGAAHDLPAYTVFVLAMSVVGGLAGAVTVFVGPRRHSRV
jgi:hypothetical protein